VASTTTTTGARGRIWSGEGLRETCHRSDDFGVLFAAWSEGPRTAVVGERADAPEVVAIWQQEAANVSLTAKSKRRCPIAAAPVKFQRLAEAGAGFPLVLPLGTMIDRSLSVVHLGATSN